MDLPVTIKTKSLIIPALNINIMYPEVTELYNPAIQMYINVKIVETLNRMLLDLGYHDPNLKEMQGYYEIKTNERRILSLSLIVYSYTGGAHGLTLIKSLTFNADTGKMYMLYELFKPDAPFVGRLSAIISQKIGEWKIPLIGDFTSIRRDQDFYLADHSLVIYFQQYEISPYVAGFPYFPIPIWDIQDLIAETGPLNTLLPFT
ncbi:DUF3298 and DUF4163 domain-containing protein [Jeotgalibacillus campisalis]|uniref:DUF3298 domain-containing protein n=1 Tax=Jeotgalibacillus campisalis TaxID=220754 RepID=A0A0C2VEW0_9BACL|nr:DUF3298 and DUF4163 domain-containing protein [Jeotgalibacillus campisalis]KIL47447.1 hypothetical protein KR50_16140 [Jeotgalibacillus campisalis]